MSDTAKFEPAPLVTITLDTRVGETYNGDPDSYGQPITIADMIVTGAVAQLVKELREDLTAKIRRETTELIRSQVADVIAEAMVSPIQKTNTWGDPTGTPTTLRSLIVEQTQEFMKERPERDFNGRQIKSTLFQQLIATEVNKAMEAELKEAITAARAKVDAAVKEKAAQLIADAVKVAGR